MINKKNVLGKAPQSLGDKDAIHVAIVAVRAGGLIKPGQKCNLNEHREAVASDKGVGVADPFRKGNITTGQTFWLLLNQDAVPNVRHVWEHPSVDFSPPTREVERNSTIEDAAKHWGVTYEQIMEACAFVVASDDSAVYPGDKTEDELEELAESFCRYDLWSEWSDETGHEFENYGTACCPEYAYPEVHLFTAAK